MTFGWGEVTGGEMTMGRNDRKPSVVLSDQRNTAESEDASSIQLLTRKSK